MPYKTRLSAYKLLQNNTATFDSKPTCSGAQWPGEDGVQGGDLQQYDHWLWEARHQGLHMDTSQGEY